MSRAKRTADSCTVERRKLVKSYTLSLSSGEQKPLGEEWRTEACGVPLFGDAERAAGKCRSCAAGWTHPENYPADQQRPASVAEVQS